MDETDSALERWQQVVGPTLDRRRIDLGLTHRSVFDGAGSSGTTWLRIRQGPTRELDDGTVELQIPHEETLRQFEFALRLPGGIIRDLFEGRATPEQLLGEPISAPHHGSTPEVDLTPKAQPMPADERTRRANAYAQLFTLIERVGPDDLDLVIRFVNSLAVDDDDEVSSNGAGSLASAGAAS